ncbi:MAG: hypothetical protein LBQ86_09335 [Holophagales bacterium]|jgi:hypothetical protein|nr:hypothetical protein [Holophagales bacterium]
MFFFPGDVEITMQTEDEIEAVCWRHCQNDDYWKYDCFHDGCPLAKIELQRLHELRELLAARRAAEHRCFMLRAAAVLAACT